MRLSAYRNNDRPQIMVIPMIDIIFFLLVFYIVSTLYMSEQRNLAIQLPSSASASVQAGSAVVITIAADDTLILNDMPLDVADVAKHVRQFTGTENVRFVIRADKNARHGLVVAVLDQLKSGGATNVSIATAAYGVNGP